MLSITLEDLVKRPILTAFVTISSLWLLTFTVKLILWRLHFRRLQAQGLPMPPHSLLLGHAPIIAKLLGQLPSDAHPHYMPDEIRRAYPDLGPNYYMDLWPFAPSMLVLGSPETLYQISHEHLLQKTYVLRDFLRPLTDNLDLTTMEGATWKKWRAVFNPGFSSAHLMTLVPLIVKETETYCQLLEKHVQAKDIFPMKRLTDNLTLDIIGRVALDLDFDCQRVSNRVVNSLRTQIKWLSTGVEPNFFDRYNPLRPFVQWYHSRIVNDFVARELDKRFAMRQHQAIEEKSTKLKRNRTIMDLAIDTYNKSNEAQEMSKSGPPVMDPYFRKICISQLKIFLFGGHDTTSSSICFHLYHLAQNPSILSKVRAEHDTIFGTDPSTAASKIASSPHLLNQIPYTVAVIKESMRITPPITTTRAGEPNFSVRDSENRLFPTEDFLIFTNMHSPHLNPAYWPDVESFIPDRWLVGPEDPLYPTKGVWRTFEQGPRNCIGQELAMLEMKTVLVLVCRSYVFKPAYDFLDREAGRVQPTVHGAKAYQIDQMQPRGDMPVWVEKRDVVV